MMSISRPLMMVACLSAAPLVDAATFCVGTAAEFQAALQSADTNADSSNVIKLRPGTYVAPVGGFGQNQFFDGAASITIEGGWINQAGSCNVQSEDSNVSVIDGVYAQPGLIIRRGDGSGSTIVRRLTITRGAQLGNTSNNDRGGGLVIFTSAGSHGSTTLENNAFIDNTATFIGGGAYVGGEPIIVRNNLFRGNYAQESAALATLSNDSIVALGNNTFTENVAAEDFLSTASFSGSSAVVVSNCIFWNNLGIDLFATGVNLFANLIEDVTGTPTAVSSGNFSANPRFIAGQEFVLDFHLAADSPAINKGINTPYGGLVQRELSGALRLTGANVDLGAYESDRFMADGFE